MTVFARKLDARSDDYFESALVALRQFRVQRAEWRARPVKRVTIVSEGDWLPDWRQERRLALLFEPCIKEDPVGQQRIEPIFLPHWRNRLELVAQASDLVTDTVAWRPNALDTIAITRCGGARAMARQLLQHSGKRQRDGGSGDKPIPHTPRSMPTSPSPALPSII